MKIRPHSFREVDDRLAVCEAEVAFIGAALDDRGRSSHSICETDSSDVVMIALNPQRLEYSIPTAHDVPLDDIAPIVELLRDKRVLIDSTTLGFVELFLCIRAAFEAKLPEIRVLYAEPESYKSENLRGAVYRRAFELSKRSHDFVGVPGRVILMRESRVIKAVISMGYEGGRLQRIFGQFSGIEMGATVLLGVPPFQPGWDMNAYANIVGELEDRSLRSALYCGAASPEGVYRHLERLKAGCAPNERLLLAPIGTKPHGLGMALFAAAHSDVGLVYDCPERATGRSEGVGLIHSFHCTLVSGN